MKMENDFKPKYRIMDMETGYILHGIVDTKQSHHAIWRPKSQRVVAKFFASVEKALAYADSVGLSGFYVIDDLGNIMKTVNFVYLQDKASGRLVHDV